MSRARGNAIENLFCDLAEELGYCAFPSRGSRGPVDVICFQSEGMKTILVPLAVQVGTQGKAIAATLDELRYAPRPIGSLCIVARYCKLKNGRRLWRFASDDGDFLALSAVINARQSRAAA